MSQTIRSVVLELQPDSVERVRRLLEQLSTKAQASNSGVVFRDFRSALPLLHFMSATVFTDDAYDPILVIEVNFDGPPGPFWAQFEAAVGEAIRTILRHGKTPSDGVGELFRAVTAAGSRAPLAPLLEALAIPPAVGHQGNRGRSRAQIEEEGEVFAGVQKALDDGVVHAGATQREIHTALRAIALPQYSCLRTTPSPRISVSEKVADLARLAAFVALIGIALILPGIAVSFLLPPLLAVVVLVVAGCALESRLDLPRHASMSIEMIGRLPYAIGGAALFVGLLAATYAYPACFHNWHPEHYLHHLALASVHFAVGLVGVFPTIVGVIVWLRVIEMGDPSQDAPRQDERTLVAMAQREDVIAQNHMGSVVHLKPGVLRAVLARAALLGLGLVLRVLPDAQNGFLGSMRTIHFAHWAIISNGARLMFLSNFDGSWESYLDDFIEKAHCGLTLAWTSSVGFPPTRYLVLDGATQGRKFKAWARHSMVESVFWFSAYPAFTVNQIERNARIADGLRKTVLSETEAAEWALDL